MVVYSLYSLASWKIMYHASILKIYICRTLNFALDTIALTGNKLFLHHYDNPLTWNFHIPHSYMWSMQIQRRLQSCYSYRPTAWKLILERHDYCRVPATTAAIRERSSRENAPHHCPRYSHDLQLHYKQLFGPLLHIGLCLPIWKFERDQEFLHRQISIFRCKHDCYRYPTIMEKSPLGASR